MRVSVSGSGHSCGVFHVGTRANRVVSSWTTLLVLLIDRSLFRDCAHLVEDGSC